ncbi:peptidylprolyl isomerase [Sneathiella sp.]|uniref:peptidylprolyl isomerase n=1 Tax=Sneathiella sp. TaxID=1964365 RepID=UPI00356B4890
MRIQKMIKSVALATYALAFLTTAAAAQDVQSIAAIVNDEIISGYDLNQRISLTIALSGFPDTDETRKQLATQTLNRLVDDRLKMQEAARFNISVSDDEVLKSFSLLEKANNMPPGEVDRILETNHIDPATMLAQVRANLIWNKLIEARMMPNITISEEEIAAVQQRLEANKGKTEYLLSEIYLGAAPGANENQVRGAVNNLVGQLRSGASFARAAAQFSQGTSATTGGSIGWVLAEEVPPEVAEVLPQLREKEISDPIRTADGYFIVSVQRMRKILESNPNDVTLDLTQFVIPPGVDGDLEAQEKLAKTMSGFIDSCDYVPDVLTEIGDSDSGKLGRIRLGDLPDAVKELLKDLKPNEASEPYHDGDLYRVFVVCDRDDPQARSTDFEQIRREIMLRRAQNRARGYLQDLHNAATIEIR